MKKLIVIVLIFISGIINSQTIFYWYRLQTAPISPAINAVWTKVANNTYTMMYPSKSAYCIIAAAANLTSEASGTTSPQQMISATLISQPLIAQTLLSGAVFSAQIRALKTATPSTGLLQVYVRLCNEDGTNVREIGNASNATALTTTLTNRTLTFTLGGNITINDNDRIIIELGESFTAGNNNHQCSVGSNTNSLTSDLPVDNTTITGFNPWFQFSQTLSFRNIGINL